MTAIRKSGGANVALTTLKRMSVGVEVAIQNGYRRAAGAWVRVYSAYVAVTATATPNPFSASGSGTNNIGPASGSITANPSGGNGSYTYLWQVVSGSISIANAGSKTATLTVANIADGATVNGSVRCQVSDGASTAYTPTVTCSFTYTKVV